MVRAVEKLTHALLTNDKQARDVTVFAKNIAIHAFVVPASKFKGLECAMMTLPVNEVKVKDANDPGYTAGTLECVIPGQTTFSSHVRPGTASMNSALKYCVQSAINQCTVYNVLIHVRTFCVYRYSWTIPAMFVCFLLSIIGAASTTCAYQSPDYRLGATAL